MSSPGQEFVEVFLQEASEHLQFLREYSGVLLDPYPAQEELERLYLAAHTLKGSSAMYGFPLFSEVAAKLAHIFQYAINVGISPDAATPLVEFISETVAVLESDLWLISSNACEAADDIAAFKAKYPFAFQAPPDTPAAEEPQEIETPQVKEQIAQKKAAEGLQEIDAPDLVGAEAESLAPAALPGEQRAVAAVENDTSLPTHTTDKHVEVPTVDESASAEIVIPAGAHPSEPTVELHPERVRVAEAPSAHSVQVLPADDVTASAEEPLQVEQAVAASLAPTADVELPPDGEVPAEILEFFVPEAEEHLQVVTECLLSLEANPNEEDVHRLFRAMHTIKGSAAQVGLPRIALVAHRAEDLVGRLRDGALKPSAAIVDLCLESVDTLKKFLYRQWPDEATAQRTTSALLASIARLAPEEEAESEQTSAAAAPAPSEAPVESPVEPRGLDSRSEEDPFTLGDLMETAPAESAELLATESLRDLVAPPQAVPDPVVPTEMVREAAATAGVAAEASVFVVPDVVSASENAGLVEVSQQSAPAKVATVPAPDTRPADITPPAGSQQGSAAGVKVETPRRRKEDIAAASARTTPNVSAVGVVKSALEVVVSSASDAPGNGSSDLDTGLVLKKDPGAVPASRSVRIALERLDRMMNAVGELVINRTRMLGRVAELERLADVLNFSKARMSDKITEFQEKYEFSRLTGLNPLEQTRPSGGYEDRGYGSGSFGQGSGSFASGSFGSAESFPFRGGYSSYSQKFDASLAEFSELEMDRYDEFSILSRSLTEISADITEILTQLDGFVRRVDSDIDEFTKLAHRLQDEITAARMVPIGNLYTRISRTVRDAAKAAGKQVELQLTGAETELDNNIIQQIADPLLHLVRNAVAHGIECAEERYEQGKPDQGNVHVRAYHRGNHIYVEVEDDGRGLDYEKVRATAVELGIVRAEHAARLTEHELQDLLFHPGFSTAARKTELAGRGVGLDVVRANVSAMNGEIEIETQKGFGTRFTLKVPLTLIISQALFVRCGGSIFAFPLAFVEEIRRIREEQIEEVGGKLLTKVRDVVTEVVRLDRQLGLDPVEAVNGYYRLVIVNVAGRQIGIVVEEVLRKDEIVIKNLGEYLRNVKLFPGATIAPDGSLILLVDVNRLIAGEAIERRPLLTAANAARLFFPGAMALASGEVPDEAIDLVPEEKVVVLADDSISVRKFVGRMLEKAGFRVKLASDGLEALEIVGQSRCDLVVTDLEMPRTNGYELMAHLRQNPETREVPVMVVTSRAGAKHRDKAVKQGATEFMVKPVQEDQFVAAVEKLIGKSTEPRSSARRGAQAGTPQMVQERG